MRTAIETPTARVALLLVTALLVIVILSFAGSVCADEHGNYIADTTFTPGAWTLVVIPDIQSYVDHSNHFPVLMQMMQWIVDNRDDRNIALVIQVGDLVYQNDVALPEDSTGNQASAAQWANAKQAFMLLDDVVPYILVTGNHDYGLTNANSRETRFNDYFQPTDNSLINPACCGILAGMGTNAAGDLTLENAYYDFTAPDGRQMLFLALEWGPRQAAVNWANEIARMEQYADHTKVLVTHAYMNYDDTRLDWLTYGTLQPANPHEYTGTNSDTNDGEELWNKLVRKHRGFELVLSGHVGGDQRGYLASTGNKGDTVHQFLFNAQFLPLGGEGWLRLMEFQPDGTTVLIRTFSPYFDDDGDPDTSPWKTDAENHFTIQLSPLAD